MAAEIAHSHHEQYDGSGYPQGLKGDQIPISAQILGIADIYDALRSERAYKPVFSHQKTLQFLTAGDDRLDSAKHFSPNLLEIFK
jgi:HD-GYP domain-containing protein (c-di-GMP phosphodiesterase class II)